MPNSSLKQLLEDVEIVDLSVTLSDEFPCAWPGHMYFDHKVWTWYAPVEEGPQTLRSLGPYYTCWMTLDEHAGTHFDAPPHFVPPARSGLPHAGDLGDQYGDAVALGKLQGDAAVIDVRGLRDTADPGISPLVDVAHIREWEGDHGELGAGDVVILQSGWDELYIRYPEGSRYAQDPLIHRSSPGWPAPSAETVLYLVDRGISLMATDAPSIGACHEPASMHYAGLERGMLFVESLCNLDRLPVRGSYFVFLPLKVARSSGAPGRALAYVPRSSSDERS